jgi:hypothetical protein
MPETRSEMTRIIRGCPPFGDADDTIHTKVICRRHLVRLWLRNDGLAWTTPKPLEVIWKRLYSVDPDQQRFPPNPEIRRKANGMAK